ncbi:receptor-like protein 6 isoform X1 [Senna tora]|uniref:Receptor-like protein 6 isoform X1 n=1 Tax=Senna tora TaxID=362788 RepID=A0A834TRT0_9FABA|nr:receptor-like protein 6 isoform X1 [Senna tora]
MSQGGWDLRVVEVIMRKVKPLKLRKVKERAIGSNGTIKLTVAKIKANYMTSRQNFRLRDIVQAAQKGKTQKANTKTYTLYELLVVHIMVEISPKLNWRCNDKYKSRKTGSFSGSSVSPQNSSMDPYKPKQCMFLPVVPRHGGIVPLMLLNDKSMNSSDFRKHGVRKIQMGKPRKMSQGGWDLRVVEVIIRKVKPLKLRKVKERAIGGNGTIKLTVAKIKANYMTSRQNFRLRDIVQAAQKGKRSFTALTSYIKIKVLPALCHEDERSALLQFNQSFVINKFASQSYLSYPKTVSWIRTTDCCSWDGVECDNQTGHVIGLDLSSSQLYGSIASNSSLFHLSQLQRLNLSYNHFNYSQIPSSLGHLSRLTHLDLSWSKFSGEIPDEISQLSKLLILNLCCNYVSSFPAINLLQLKQQNFISIIQNLTNVQLFSLSYVNISSPIPNIITNLSSLRDLSLKSTGVYGEFPIGIFHLPNLRRLIVRLNQDLTGYLPASIGNITSLKVILLGRCRFSGSIPSSLGNLTQLQYLELSNNMFHGEIPHSIFSLDNLSFLSLGQNLLEGQLELNLFLNLKRLKYLSLSHNNLSLLIDTSSSSNASLPRNFIELALAACNINEFPKLLKDQNRLEVLDLSRNKMHETLPMEPYHHALEPLAKI